MRPDQSFKGRQFTTEVILWAVRWYLMFPISYRDLEVMLQDRSVEIAHTTLFRWVQAYVPPWHHRPPRDAPMFQGAFRLLCAHIGPCAAR